jgi:Lrp/AsnC family transcriptional regulator, leucine-responsive regulatory protein
MRNKSEPVALDKFDRRILEALQSEGRLSNQELAEKIGLSAAPCWRRVKRLEAEGLIDGYVAQLNAQKLGLTVTAFTFVSLDNHHPGSVEAFDRVIRECPEVMECYSLSGQQDFLLRIVAADLASYEEFLSRHVLSIASVRSASTSFVLKRKKFTTRIPLPAP